jgi:hypothetical protein
MAAPVIQFKRGLLADLPGLRAGEPGFTTDSYDFYIGISSELSTNKFFGSNRYWKKETTSTGSGLNLVEGTANGSGYITLKSPDTLAGVGTYTLPDTNTITDGYFLKVSSDGTLSWDTSSGTGGSFTDSSFAGITSVSGSLNVSASSDFSGITTFSNTEDNTLGDSDTGAVQINGGLGVDKNVTVGGNLNVQGHSEFVGVVTFRGGTINLGDGNTDNINVGGEFVSDLTPNDDDTYDIGTGAQRWRNANFSGIVTTASLSTASLTLASGATVTAILDEDTLSSDSDTAVPTQQSVKAYVDSQVTAQDLDIQADSGGALSIDLDSETLTIAGTVGEIETSGSSNTITIGLPDTVVVGTAVSTPTLQVATIKHNNGTSAATIDTSGNFTASQNLTVTGNLYVNGSTTQVNTSSMTVEDRTIELGQVDGSLLLQCNHLGLRSSL